MRIVAVTVLIFLFACGRGPYWENTAAAGPVYSVVEVEHPETFCGRPALGCYNGSYIYLQQGMEAALRLCVLRHEYRHAAGDRHTKFDNDTAYGVDCGDGTVMPGLVV